MNHIINKRAAEHLEYVCLMAIPIWLAWIPFDYYFAGEQFNNFVLFRVGGSISTLVVYYLLKKTNTSIILLQSIIFFYFTAAKGFMLILIDKDALDIYFQAFSMITMFMFFILILRPIELFLYTAMAVVSLIVILVLSPIEVVYILGNGAYVFMTVLVVMLTIGVLRYKGALRDAVLSARIVKAQEIEVLNTTLEKSVKEKETLLQEIHHRVKNNLQIISSILSLQNVYVKDERTQNTLRESINRIQSMSVIHETLYKSKDFSAINFSDYLLELTKNIITTYKDNSYLEIKVISDLSDLRLNIKQAIPCGLIVNEIITNAVKYAFVNREVGKIYLTIKLIWEKVNIEIGDDGVGLPEDFIVENSESLGLQLVDSLVEQLDGAFEIESSNGTYFKIEFPLDKSMNYKIDSKKL